MAKKGLHQRRTMEEENPDNGVSDSASPPPSFSSSPSPPSSSSSSPSPSPSPVCAAFFSFRSFAFSVSGEAGIKSYQSSCCLNVKCKNNDNYFRSDGRPDGYEALESESFREGSLLQSLDETSKIRNGFADLFDQFQSFGDESQNNVTF